MGRDRDGYGDFMTMILFQQHLCSLAGFPKIYLLIRVFTFNDCEEAAKELQVEISEAREDLRSKGFNFEDKSVKKTD